MYSYFASLVVILLVLSTEVGGSDVYSASTVSLAGGNEEGGPIAMMHARHARLLVHENVWGVMATISVPFKGSAFANIVSYSDGIGYSRENATGTMYFYLSITDTTTVDLKANPNATVALSKAQGGEKACYMDAEDPTCWRLSLTGKVEPVKDEDRDYAERVLFSKHPQMKHWPKKHGFVPYVLAIEHLIFLDFYGSAKHIAVNDYYKVKL